MDEIPMPKLDREHEGAARGAAYLDSLTTAPEVTDVPQLDDSGIEARRADTIEAQPMCWLWPGRIARGKVSLIAGHPGLGKSQLVLNMAATISTGSCWPVDGTRAECGSVAILSAEDDAADTIVPRLKATGADLSRVHILEAVREIEPDGSVTRRPFNLRLDIVRLSALLARIGDVRLVGIDPVTAYLGATDSQELRNPRAACAIVRYGRKT